MYRLKKVKILVVDDQEDVRTSIGRYLSDQGADVWTCEDVDEVLHVFPRLQPDLVLADVCMPQKDGFDLLREIRSIERAGNTPVVAMTGEVNENSEQKALRSGFNAFLGKPFPPGELVRVIKDLLEF